MSEARDDLTDVCQCAHIMPLWSLIFPARARTRGYNMGAVRPGPLIRSARAFRIARECERRTCNISTISCAAYKTCSLSYLTSCCLSLSFMSCPFVNLRATCRLLGSARLSRRFAFLAPRGSSCKQVEPGGTRQLVG